MKRYLEALKKSGIKPNFWCSEEYAKFAGWKVECRGNNDFILVMDSENTQIFPPLFLLEQPLAIPHRAFRDSIWSDFEGSSFDNSPRKEFLDYEYIYRPQDFLYMEGHKWATFRKNARKWPDRIGLGVAYRPIPIDTPTPTLDSVLLSWLGTLSGDSIVHGDEIMLRYLHEGENRWGVYTDDGELHAINIWDRNYHYTNFRFCICRNEPFLSEYARLRFYLDMAHKNTLLVNDGGVLDRPQLKAFKDKMNPVQVRNVYSLKGVE